MPDSVPMPRNASPSIDGPTSGEGPTSVDGARGFDGSADTRHSASNIAEWLSYLPKDCVATMIEMGWDKTT